jgi:tRNA-modifying protein YgfZ
LRPWIAAQARLLPLGQDIWQIFLMKAALLPDRGVIKIAGEDTRKFLNGLITVDTAKVTPTDAAFAALLTPQGKVIGDFIVAEAPEQNGGGFFLDCPRALATTLVQRFNFYRLRAKVIIEDLSDALGVMALWEGEASSQYGLCYADPRLLDLGMRCMLAPHLAAEAAAELGAELVEAAAYEAHRIAHAIPRGGLDFIYGDAFPHDTDMDQLGGVDFDKGCFIGQEVVSRIEHRGTARTRAVAVRFDRFAPEPGTAVVAGERAIGTFGSSAQGRGIATLRLDRLGEALAEGKAVSAGGIELHVAKPVWARFAFPAKPQAAQ